MTSEELKVPADEAQARFNAMSPEQQAIHRYEQRRSFMRGSCPSNRDYTEWCKRIDKLLPPIDGLGEIDALVVIAKALSK